jgi:hypothetical protein
MEPGVGAVAVAAARAFGHRKAGSRQLRKTPPQAAQRFPGLSQPLPSKQIHIQGPRLRSRSLCRVSRFQNMAVKALH